MNTNKPIPQKPSQPENKPGKGRSIDARELFGQSNVVFIEYQSESYQLRQTRNGKLILTK